MSVTRRIHERNDGLRRVSRLTTITLAGGMVLSGIFSVLAQHAFAGTVQRKASLIASSRIPAIAATNGPDSTTTTAPDAPLSGDTTPTSQTSPTPQSTTSKKRHHKWHPAATTAPGAVHHVRRSSTTTAAPWTPPPTYDTIPQVVSGGS